MKKITIFFVAAVLALCALAGCGKKDDNKIRLIEVTRSVFYAPQYLALADGYFTEQGLEVELTTAAGSNECMTAVLSGGADIGLQGPETAVYVVAEGKKDFPIIFGQLTKRDGSFLVGRTQDPDFSYDKVKNTEVLAGRVGGMPNMTLQWVLKNNNVFGGVNVTLNTEVAFANMFPAFIGGQGEYVALFEPLASEVERQGKGYIVASIGADSGEVPYTAYIAAGSYLKDKAETAEKFLAAVYKAMTTIKTMPAAEVAAKILGYFPGSTVEQITAAVERYVAIDAWMSDPVMKRDAFERMQSIMENAGQLPDGRAEYDKVVDNTIAQKLIDAKK